MSKFNSIKKFAIFLLVFVVALALTACGSSDNSPTGSLSSDKTYMNAGNYSVNELEVYNAMKQQGSSQFVQMVTDLLIVEKGHSLALADFTTGENKDHLNTLLDDFVNSAIFGVTKLEDLEKLETVTIQMAVEKFVDSLYLLDNNVNIDEIRAALLALVQSDTDPFKNYHTISVVFNRYKSSVEKRVYAETFVNDDAVDEDGDYYVSDDSILSYYKSNLQNRGDVEVFFFHFINQNEADGAMRTLNLKINNSGEWFLLPNIGAIPLADRSEQLQTPELKKVYDTLVKLQLLQAYLTDANFGAEGYRNTDNYKKYYNSYSVNKSTSTEYEKVPETALIVSNYDTTEYTVKQAMVDLYNLVNVPNLDDTNSKFLSIKNDGTIIYKNSGEVFKTTYTYDELNTISTTLRSHVYTTLISEDVYLENEANDVANTKKPASSKFQSVNALRYLAYKLETVNDDAVEIINSDTSKFYTEDDDAFKALSTEKQAQVLARIETVTASGMEKLKKDMVTTTYITSKVTNLINEADIQIYDELTRLFFSRSYTYEGKNKNKSGNTLATVNGKEITVDAFYAALEKAYGINIASDLLVNKVLLDASEYELKQETIDGYRDEVYTIIENFSNGAYESSGYPASLGREAFLLLIFGSKDIDTIVQTAYVLPQMKTLYLADYEAHYDNVYEKLAALAAKQYDNYRSLSASHLLVYFDQNGDGTPDDPKDYLGELSAAEQTTILNKIVELVELIYDEVGKKNSLSSGLTALATSFNNTGRIDIGSDDPLDGDFTELRRYGLNLKFESLSSAITNSSNFLTASSRLDDAFYKRAIYLYDLLAAEYDEENGAYIPFLDLKGGADAPVSGTLDVDTLKDQLQSSFGFHFILVTTFNAKTSAKYTGSDENYSFTIDDVTYTAANDASDKITASQIEYYLKDLARDTDEDDETESLGLPTDLAKVFTTYFTPISTLYSSSNNYMPRELYFMLLLNQGAISGVNVSRFNTIRAINIRQFHGYLITDTEVRDANYAALYGDWFDVLNGN